MVDRLFVQKVFFLILSAIAILLLSCSSEDRMKNSLISEIASANGDFVVVDLNRLSNKEVRKICLQPPYMTRGLMEVRMMEKADGFYEVDDRSFVLWVFANEGLTIRIKFQRWSELNFSDQSKGCALTSLVKSVGGKIYLNEDE